MFRGWPSVTVHTTSYDEVVDEQGTTYRIEAQVSLGDLETSDVDVQVVHGAVELDDDLIEPTIEAMTDIGDGDVPGWHRYRHEVRFDRAGNFGFTVRVVGC